MMATVRNPGVQVKVDPTLQYDNQPVYRIIQACGLVVSWAAQKPQGVPLREHLQACYQFPLYEINGGRVDETGIFRYPGDPPQYPYVRIHFFDTGEAFYQYPHAVIAIIDKDGGAFVTRMD